MCLLLSGQLFLLMSVNILGLKPPLEECAERRDSRLKGQSACCQSWPYCRCVTSLCRSKGKKDGKCTGEVMDTCGKKLVKDCEDYDSESTYSKGCPGLDWNVLLDKDWVVPDNPDWVLSSSDGGGANGGRVGGAGKLSLPAIFGGLVAFIILLLLLCTAVYCWSLGSKKKKSCKETTQQRSSGQHTKQQNITDRKSKVTKKKAAKKAAGGPETSADVGNDSKSRSKVRHSSVPRGAVAARPPGASGTEKKELSGKVQRRLKGASKAATGLSSFNSRQVNTVDLKTTGANARVAMGYTKFRNALA